MLRTFGGFWGHAEAHVYSAMGNYCRHVCDRLHFAHVRQHFLCIELDAHCAMQSFVAHWHRQPFVTVKLHYSGGGL